jgi:hypothetical protein
MVLSLAEGGGWRARGQREGPGRCARCAAEIVATWIKDEVAVADAVWSVQGRGAGVGADAARVEDEVMWSTLMLAAPSSKVLLLLKLVLQGSYTRLLQQKLLASTLLVAASHCARGRSCRCRSVTSRIVNDTVAKAVSRVHIKMMPLLLPILSLSARISAVEVPLAFKLSLNSSPLGSNTQ